MGALRPGVTQEAVDALYEQIGEFQAKYPWITVEPEEYNWTAPTFTAALAGGTLPDVFTIPFTDGKGLIANHQIVDIDARVRALGYADKFNPNVLVNGQDADGKIFAVPTAAYGMSLTYNRSLFTAAGLDPNTPPTTWDEVRAAAKTIAEKTGVAGYAQMATENTGGWQLTTSTYALGGRMEEVGADGKVTATLNNDKTKAVLQRLKDMRWGDNSMGSTFDYAWGTMNQAFAAGQVGMFTGGSDLYTWMIQNAALKPDDYGITDPPARRRRLRRPRRRHPRRRQRRHAPRPSATRPSTGSTSTTSRSCITEEGAVADAKALTANNQPVGVPALPIFDKATYDESQVWIKDYINVPVGPDDARSRRRSSTSRSSTSRSPTPRSSTRPSTPSCRPSSPTRTPTSTPCLMRPTPRSRPSWTRAEPPPAAPSSSGPTAPPPATSRAGGGVLRPTPARPG